jgi:hypothetical protein
MTIAPITGDTAAALGLPASELPLFLREEWRAIVGEGYERLGVFNKDGRAIAAFNLHRTRRAGLRLISHPAHTQHCGLWRKRGASNPAKAVSEAKKLHALLADHLLAQDGMVHLAFPPEENDLQPWAWKGFKVVAQWTYRIDLSAGMDAVRAGYEAEQRNAIRKSRTGGAEVVRTEDPERVLACVRRTFVRKGKGLNEDIATAMMRAFLREGSGSAFVTTENGHDTAGAFCARDARTAYYLLGGVDKAKASAGAGALAVDACIAQAQVEGLSVFDFEGSMLPEVERYFRSFGGTPTPYFTVNRAAFVTEVALKRKLRHLF